MSTTTFETMSVQEVRENLDDLLRMVVKGKQRVEIVDGSNEHCVILSKAELDSLEKALGILSDTAEFRDICNSMSQLAAATSQPAMA